MHWVALYPSSSIKSSASKARSPCDSISTCIPETPSVCAEVTVHCPCQVAEVSEDLPRTPFSAELGTDDRAYADPDDPLRNELRLRKGSPSPQTSRAPRTSPPTRMGLNRLEGFCCMGGNRGGFTGTRGGGWNRRSTTGNRASQR